MTTPYWEGPEWAEQLEKNVQQMTAAWQHDWGPYFHAIAERCGISLQEAILYTVSSKIHWWTDENWRFSASYAPVVEQMKKEIEDLKHGDDWKAPE